MEEQVTDTSAATPRKTAWAVAVEWFKACLIVGAMVLVLIFLSLIYFRHPHLKSFSPFRIDLTAYRSELSETNYLTSITNPVACLALIDTLKKASLVMPHPCKSTGTLTILYGNGESDVLGFFPGHHPESFEIRVGNHYRLSKAGFFQAMKDAGVDTSKIRED